MGARTDAVLNAFLARRYRVETGGETDGGETCRTCGGACCRIYAQEWQGGTLTAGEDLPSYWRGFHACRADYGVAALYDAERVHAIGDRTYADDLRARGIDPLRCEYSGPDGCLVPRDRLPVHCRAYACNRLAEALRQSREEG